MYVLKDRWTYETTHPWITFDLDLRRASPTLWIALGEARSKCEHIAGVPLAPEMADRMHNVYLARGALATTAIEGNTLSEREVREYLDGKLKLPPSREYLGKEIDNIVKACNVIVGQVAEDGVASCGVGWIKWMNSSVLDGLSIEEDVVPGEIRQHSVEVGRYRGAPADECEYLLDKLCEWLNGRTFEAPRGLEIVYGIIKAIVSHLYLAWMHPFGDGNGRTARLLEFKILLMCGLPSPAAHLLSNHYNKTKSEYYRQLDAVSRSGGNILPFMEYAIQGIVDGLREQIDHIKKHQIEVAWTNYIHDCFAGKESSSDNRRKTLVLDLSKEKSPTPIHKIGQISARLAVQYSEKTYRTISRDVNELLSMDLIRRVKGGVVANRNKILAFLPWRNTDAIESQPESEDDTAFD